MTRFWTLAWGLLLAQAASSSPPSPSAPSLPAPALIDVGVVVPDARLELKYATADNFTGKRLYPEGFQCSLVKDAADMLVRARAILQARAPELTFVLYDCARPRSVQILMWSLVEGTSKQGYVANPYRPWGSLHNTGCAVDLGLWDKKAGAAVDMGTPFDYFGKKAEPRAEVELWKQKQLTNEQWANRLLLREVMLRAGFQILAHEWWHFDCADGKTAKAKYPVIP